MGNPLGAASVSDHDDTRQHANSSQSAKNAAGALQELHIDDSSSDVGGNRSFPGEGRTFTVDPNVFTQWNAGRPGIIDSDGAYGAHQASSSVAAQTNGAQSDSTDQPTVSTDALVAGAPTEVGVGSTKKKSKSNKKSKSKRGLVQAFQELESYCHADILPLLGSTHRIRRILCGRAHDSR